MIKAPCCSFFRETQAPVHRARARTHTHTHTHARIGSLADHIHRDSQQFEDLERRFRKVRSSRGMNTGNLRRRVRHEDVGGYKYERMDSAGAGDLNEPLLARSDDDSRIKFFDDDDVDWEEKKHEAQLMWSQIFVRLLAQWAQFFAVLFGRASWPGSLLFWGAAKQSEFEDLSDDQHFTPVQEERLRLLQGRMEIPFDGTSLEHQEALRELWTASFPERDLIDLVSEQWKDMGWQGKDPSTDFRGGGFISLENLLFFAKEYPKSFQRLLHKEQGRRATWEYPFAVAGINISFMLIQILDLRSVKPGTGNGRRFVKLLEEDEFAFDRLYCVAFEMMDAQWLAMKASYMEFNAVLKATQAQLERELALDDLIRVQDLPGFNLLLS